MLTRSAWSLAKLLGNISPKTSTSTVITAVATAAPCCPSSDVAMTVEIDDAVRFTTLLPMRMADSVLS